VGGPNVQRILSALNRFKWLIVLCTMLGAAGGAIATRWLSPEYEVQSRIVLEQGTGTREGGSGAGNPIMARELLDRSGWTDLLTSYMVADPVVTDLGLFVQPAAAADSALFRQFRVDARLRPGDYLLTVDGGDWRLSLDPGVEVERGAVGDSIGRTVGFAWQPTADVLDGRREVAFSVQTPREASNALIKRLQMVAPERGSFLLLKLTGADAAKTARTLNAWVEQFVAVATSLKKRNVSLFAAILEGQRAYAAQELQAAESALERFRVQTITEPNERQAVTPGIELTTNPALNQYFTAKNTAESLKRDREALARVLAEGKAAGAVSREAVLSIPSVNTDPAAEQVRRLLAEQADREVQLRQLRARYTDEFREVRIALEQLEQHRTVLVPRAVEDYLSQLTLRERQLESEIARGGQELRGMPVRAIEEQRLKRKVEVADAMYRNLDVEAARAKLAEAQTIPDISVLDTAVAPLRPTRNTAPVLILGAVAGGLGLGILLALLLDRTDKRFRYPEQATDELGLFVLGAVPAIDPKGRRRGAEQAAQVVEAFRSIRMNVRYAADPTRPLALTITSPGPSDGKSLVSSNLALSFAESGARTLLIDGDIRRGELAKTFGVDARPGLVEYLDGTALIAEVLRPVASHPNLTLLSAGVRRKRAPELLATPRLSQLVAQMCSEYDVVIVDSPPLGAGFDAYALGTATGNMALVLRTALTDRKMAAAKLAVVSTLPIRVLGTVLNGVKLAGLYEYYSFYQDYAATDEDAAALPSPTPKEGRRSVAVAKP
jgi:tyrosine-protein kinase Etk/Wzc